MFCSRCGKENPDNAKYCCGCGGSLGSPWPVQGGSWPTPPYGGWQQDPRIAWQQDPGRGGMIPPGLSKKKFARHPENSGSWAALLIFAIIFYAAALFILFRRVQNIQAILQVMKGGAALAWYVLGAVEVAVLVMVILAQLGLNEALAWVAAGISCCEMAYGLVTFLKGMRFDASMIRIIVISYGPGLVWALTAIVVACLISSINRKYKRYKVMMRMEPF